jgi:hypothetical protein
VQEGSTGDAINKCGIVASSAGSVYALRYGSDMKQIFGRRAQEFDVGRAVELRFETIAAKNCRHAVVNAAGKFISFRHDHCAGEQELTARNVVPFIPKASD